MRTFVVESAEKKEVKTIGQEVNQILERKGNLNARLNRGENRNEEKTRSREIEKKLTSRGGRKRGGRSDKQ